MPTLTVLITNGRNWYEGARGLRYDNVRKFDRLHLAINGDRLFKILKDDCMVTAVHYEDKEAMSMQFQCDITRCRRAAVWHGFDGRSHFCTIHAPSGMSERPYTPGLGAFKDSAELTGLTIKPKRKRR